MDEHGKAAQKEIDDALHAKRLAERRQEIEAFIADHADFNEHKSEILALIKQSNNTIPTERAYLYVKADKGLLGNQGRKLNRLEKSRARAQGASRPGGGRGATKKDATSLKGKSAQERAAILAANEDLQNELLAEMRAE